MEPQIIEALKTKFVGVDAQILGRVAKKLAKTVTTEDQVTTAVEGVTIQSLFESYGDSRATEAQQTAVSTYEKKHGLKDGKVTGGAPTSGPATDPNPNEGGNDLSKQVTAAVAAAVKPLQDEVTALKSGKVSETRQQALKAIIGKLPENLQKPYSRLSVTDMSDEEFENLTSEITTEVSGLLADVTTKGAVFTRPVGGGASTTAPVAKDVETVVGAMGL